MQRSLMGVLHRNRGITCLAMFSISEVIAGTSPEFGASTMCSTPTLRYASMAAIIAAGLYPGTRARLAARALEIPLAPL
jgi:hypothetical protein